ncbi:MAG: J domain-containing protein [Anaerolineae bacterium]|nr:J domain-containing protein [Anaerolineae bacterium]
MQPRDYYHILGVDRKASEKDIKKAYRRLAREHHPDLNPGDKRAEDRFKDINEAHEVLSDPEKRAKYDRFGAQWQQYEQSGGRPGGFDWSQWAGPGQGGATTQQFTADDLQRMYASAGTGGFSDFFESLFGGAGQRRSSTNPAAGAGRGQSRVRRGQDIEQTLEITLEEAFNGTTRLLQRDDNSTGEVHIPKGVQTGSRVRVSGVGSAGTAGGNAGDLYLKIAVKPHPVFERRGDDLVAKAPVDLYTAILGGNVQVPTMTGPVMLTVPPETANGKTIRLRGQGMPLVKGDEQRGDLYIEVQVTTPRNLSPREMELFKQLADLRKAGGAS